MKTSWIIGTATVVFGYFAVVNVLAQRGYNAYFNIPSQYVNFSIEDNIAFARDMLQIFVSALTSVPLWGLWLFLIVVLCIVLAKVRLGIISGAIGVFFLISFAWNAYHFGEAIAKTQIRFHVLSSGCALQNADTYIIPTFHGDTALLVPISADRKLVGSVLPKNIDELGCGFEEREVGLVTR